MADKIIQLEDRVINQIAAGEVVERPVAVVKELVENSLDAEADRIEVVFEKGGKSLIRVSDNGQGMSRRDAEMSLERHATSKIRQVDDILQIGSFGFRGEALPSIASVSRFVLKTRREEDEAGTEIRISGGKGREVRSCGMAPGTTIEVAQLFNSVPARRKFLKTDRTEAAHIIQLCRLVAVCHPQVAFTLIEDSKTIFKSPVCNSREDRIREIYGRERARELMPIDYEDEGIHLYGLVSKIGTNRATRAELITFVNGRPVDNRVLNYALIESYHTYLPKGRYPMSFLFVDVPPGSVDVNVHPAKREVRFKNEGEVRKVVMEGIIDRLKTAARSELKRMERVEPTEPQEIPKPILRPQSIKTESPGQKTKSPAQVPEQDESSKTIGDEKKDIRLSWKFKGTLMDKFGIFEGEDGLILFNPGSATERIKFEEILGSYDEEKSMKQELLIPTLLEMDPVSATIIEEQGEFFRDMGFELESFGGHSFRLRTYPNWFVAEAAESFVEDLILKIRERGIRPDRPEIALEAVAEMASRRLASQKRLPGTEEDWVALAEQLLNCRQPLSDTRGRKTFLEIQRTELNKHFGLNL